MSEKQDTAHLHHKPSGLSDHVAYGLGQLARVTADVFFRKRYGHRAVVLETIAAVPGMVGGLLIHLKSLRRIEDDKGRIRLLLDEAENERMHLLVYVSVARPTILEHFVIVSAQFLFSLFYFCTYVLSARTAHRFVGYLEEEAVHSYSVYLSEVESGKIPNISAPSLAIDYWHLQPDATVRDGILATRADEMHHRDVNHRLATEI